MRLIKYSHACVRLERDGSALVIDPGTFSEAATALDGANGVLITHEHQDHIDTDALLAAARANPDLRVWTHEGIAESLGELGERVQAVTPGQRFDAAGFDVRVFGGLHAVNHPDIPRVANLAYLVEGVFHPGDSLTAPDTPVETLLVPTCAPWLRLPDAIDYTRALRPRRAYSIHDAMLSELGERIVDNNMTRFTESYGVEYARIPVGESVEA